MAGWTIPLYVSSPWAMQAVSSSSSSRHLKLTAEVIETADSSHRMEATCLQIPTLLANIDTPNLSHHRDCYSHFANNQDKLMQKSTCGVASWTAHLAVVLFSLHGPSKH